MSNKKSRFAAFSATAAVEKIKFPEKILDNLTWHDYNNLANEFGPESNLDRAGCAGGRENDV